MAVLVQAICRAWPQSFVPRPARGTAAGGCRGRSDGRLCGLRWMEAVRRGSPAGHLALVSYSVHEDHGSGGRGDTDILFAARGFCHQCDIAGPRCLATGRSPDSWRRLVPDSRLVPANEQGALIFGHMGDIAQRHGPPHAGLLIDIVIMTADHLGLFEVQPARSGGHHAGMTGMAGATAPSEQGHDLCRRGGPMRDLGGAGRCRYGSGGMAAFDRYCADQRSQYHRPAAGKPAPTPPAGRVQREAWADQGGIRHKPGGSRPATDISTSETEKMAGHGEHDWQGGAGIVHRVWLATVATPASDDLPAS